MSLLGKWLPSVNASNPTTVKYAKRIARYLGLSDSAYRKTLVRLRAAVRIIENSLRLRDYSFDYGKQPSKAMVKYRKAFLRNDSDRYLDFLDEVASGKRTMHVGTLTPYDIIAPCFRGYRSLDLSQEERYAMDVTWNAQEDFTRGENALVVMDGSGSMYSGDDPQPIAVAMSLAIYFAERNVGPFKDHFITFSHTPRLVEIKGQTITDKVEYCFSYNEVANTNLLNVFLLILNTAVENGLPQEQLPATLYIVSDMEFDCCTEEASMGNFEYAQKLFRNAGYELPNVVFWNVDSRHRQQPVTMNEQGVALVSGSSPRLFSMLSQGVLTPMGYMMEVLGSQRYAAITA